MKNALKIGTIILFLTFIGIQFIRPNVTNPPINESKTINAKL